MLSPAPPSRRPQAKSGSARFTHHDKDVDISRSRQRYEFSRNTKLATGLRPHCLGSVPRGRLKSFLKLLSEPRENAPVFGMERYPAADLAGQVQLAGYAGGRSRQPNQTQTRFASLVVSGRGERNDSPNQPVVLGTEQTAANRTHLVDIFYTSVGRNGNLILNLSPDKRGIVPESQLDALNRTADITNKTFATNLAKGCKVTADNPPRRTGGSENVREALVPEETQQKILYTAGQIRGAFGARDRGNL